MNTRKSQSLAIFPDAALVTFALLGLSIVCFAQSPVATEQSVTVGGSVCDQLKWTDETGLERSLSIVRGKDKDGWVGGYVNQLSYQADSKARVCKATAGSLGGFGHVILHGGVANAIAGNSKEHAKELKTELLVAGPAHAIYSATMIIPSSVKSKQGNVTNTGPVSITIHYFVRAGRSDFVYAVAFDTSKTEGLGADTRTPYVEFDWEGNGKYGGQISGFGWAAANRQFRTIGAPLSAKSEWDWTRECVIPHVIEWKDEQAGDAEIGLVQTQTYAQHDAGAGWWKQWGNKGKGLPENWNLTYQLNAYQGFMTKKTTWMMPYGAVGAKQYEVLDYSRKASGHPYQGYTLLCLFDKYSRHGVDALVDEMATIQKSAKLTVSKGRIVTEVPRGVGQSEKVKCEPPGWDFVYALWAVECAGNEAEVALDLGEGSLKNQTFCFSNYAASSAPRIKLNERELALGQDCYLSVDKEKQRLFITFNRQFAKGSTTISVKPSQGG